MISKIELLRNAIISQVEWKLSDYSVLGSVLLSGTQYIDTGIIPSSSTKMEIYCQSDINEAMFACGSRVAYANRMFALVNNYQGGQGWVFQVGSQTKDTKSLIPTLLYSDYVELYLSNNGSTINDVSISYNFTGVSGTSLSIYLGACNQNGVPEGRNFKGLIYKFRIWEYDKLVRDYIPVRLVSNNEVGFWDLVENKFYGNIGEGIFQDGNTSVWEYPTDMFMDYNGNCVLEYDNVLYPEWSYNGKTGDIVLSYEEALSPNIYLDRYGNIIIDEVM